MCWSSFDGGQWRSLLVEAGAAVRKKGDSCRRSACPSLLLFTLPLQLNQNLNDVLVSLEKQHGSNTFTVKAQPRWVKAGGEVCGGPAT